MESRVSHTIGSLPIQIVVAPHCSARGRAGSAVVDFVLSSRGLGSDVVFGGRGRVCLIVLQRLSIRVRTPSYLVLFRVLGCKEITRCVTVCCPLSTGGDPAETAEQRGAGGVPLESEAGGVAERAETGESSSLDVLALDSFSSASILSGSPFTTRCVSRLWFCILVRVRVLYPG